MPSLPPSSSSSERVTSLPPSTHCTAALGCTRHARSSGRLCGALQRLFSCAPTHRPPLWSQPPPPPRPRPPPPCPAPILHGAVNVAFFSRVSFCTRASECVRAVAGRCAGVCVRAQVCVRAAAAPGGLTLSIAYALFLFFLYFLCLSFLFSGSLQMSFPPPLHSPLPARGCGG